MKAIIIILILILFIRCDGQPKFIDYNIIEIDFFRRVDTLKIDNTCKIYSTQLFIVRNYSDNSVSDSLVIDFVAKHKYSLSKNIDQWNMSFYKESKITNLKNLLANRRDLDRYSQGKDLVYTFSGNKGVDNIFRIKYKNGIIISPKSKIIVEDIK